MATSTETIDIGTVAGLQTLAERLGEQLSQREALHRMTSQQRLARARRGELSAHQRGVWCAHYPDEVPQLNGIPIWIAATLCDIVDEGEVD